MAKETQTTQDAPQSGTLDYRSNYAAQLPVPQFNQPAYPLPQRNPWTVGKYLMVGAGTVAVVGLGYWVYTALQKAKTQQNPVVRRLRVAPDATTTLPQAA